MARIIIVLSLICVVLLAGYRFLATRSQDDAEAAAYSDIEKARDLVSAGDFEAARPLLEKMVGGRNEGTAPPEALMLLADVEAAAGDKEAALLRLEQAARRYEGTRDQSNATLRRAALLEEMGRTDEARALYDDVRRNTPPQVRAVALVGLGKDAERDGDVL
ncbi:MAG TPA: tetratricopeptide repeat protein [Candidatus Hydrogenedentes bacterium]|nr:tetratricopeptide repeat protein [Candidatus Hydrogenedentota bacterium]